MNGLKPSAVFLSLILFLLQSCQTGRNLKNPDNRHARIKVEILSVIEANDDSFTNLAITTSYIWVSILEPKELRSEREKLILQRANPVKYQIPYRGEIWKEIGSIHEIAVVINEKTDDIFLYPPLNIPSDEIVF